MLFAFFVFITALRCFHAGSRHDMPRLILMLIHNRYCHTLYADYHFTTADRDATLILLRFAGLSDAAYTCFFRRDAASPCFRCRFDIHTMLF